MVYGEDREVEILGKKMVFVEFSYLLHSLDIMENITKDQRTVVKSIDNIKYKNTY